MHQPRRAPIYQTSQPIPSAPNARAYHRKVLGQKDQRLLTSSPTRSDEIFIFFFLRQPFYQFFDFLRLAFVSKQGGVVGLH